MFPINRWCTERKKGRIKTSGINSLSLKNKKEKNKNKEKIDFWKIDLCLKHETWELQKNEY